MGDNTKIEWADSTWNPTVGCSKVSEGCRNCYAFDLHSKRHKAKIEGKQLPEQYTKPFSEIQLFPDRLDQPLRWRRPRQIFVNSLSDLFHPYVPDAFIEEIFEVMVAAKHHTYQILTKRPERMLQWFEKYAWNLTHTPHIWIGVTVENQQAADERIPLLLEIPAAVRFLSCEPLLGPVNLGKWLLTPGWVPSYYDPDNRNGQPNAEPTNEYINWCIVGGEGGSKARPMHPDWVGSLCDQCQKARVPFLFKQWGEWVPYGMPHEDNDYRELSGNERWLNAEGGHGFHGNRVFRMKKVGKGKAGRLLNGMAWDEYPEGAKS